MGPWFPRLACRALGTVALTLCATMVDSRHGPAVLHSATGTVAISQIYGGGGNADAPLQNDFIELVNRSTAIVQLDGWSVQYASATGATWQVTKLFGTIAPGQYVLVQEAAGMGCSGSPCGVPLPEPDAWGTIAMSATTGKVALVSSAGALSGTTPQRSDIVDKVGYGPTATAFEGTGPAAQLNSLIAALRGLGGCTDEDDNATDFSNGPPIPRNRAVVGTCVPRSLTINEIQGAGLTSSHRNVLVETRGIVTARKSNGLFIQTPDAETDGDPSTSEGLFVFTFRSPRPEAAVRTLVNIKGIVREFVPPSNPHSPPLTELADLPIVDVMFSADNQPLPAPIAMTSSDTDPAGSIEQLERLEGMRVQVDSLTVIGPTMGSIGETTATATSNGIFFGVISGLARPFREPGVEQPEPLPLPLVPRFDGNPERLRVDTRSQPGSTVLDVSAGTTVRNLVGPLDYAARTYTIVTDPPPARPEVTQTEASRPLPPPSANEWTIASFNLNRFFNDLADGPGPRLTMEAFANRLNKASLAIRARLSMPDIIGVQEAENIATLQRLAEKINHDAVADGAPDPGYQAHLIEGHDVGGIDVGFLVKRSRVTVVEPVVQEGHDEMFEGSFLHDRPPLVLKALVHPPSGDPLAVTVYVNHLRSRLDVTEPGGDRARRKRRAQAESLARLIQARQGADPRELIVSVGDYNAYEFNDGYADMIGTILGRPTPAEEVELASPDLVDPDLLNLTDTAPSPERYSYVFGGSAEALDHVLVSKSMRPRVRSIEFAHINADFPDSLRNDPNRPERLSDHDPAVAYFTFSPVSSLRSSVTSCRRERAAGTLPPPCTCAP